MAIFWPTDWQQGLSGLHWHDRTYLIQVALPPWFGMGL